MVSRGAEEGELKAETGVAIETFELRSGGCAGIDESGWGYKLREKLGRELSQDELEAEVQHLRKELLQMQDVRSVRDAVKSCGISESEQIINLVKSYNFNSVGINFNPDNYYSWRRLANNEGTINDARYLVHEIAEVKELERIKQEKNFDYMGTGKESMTRRQKGQWEADFPHYYMQAHRKALEVEYDFIANQVSKAINNAFPISLMEAAAVDPTRNEARTFMLVDGVVLREHKNFNIWQQRCEEIVQLNRTQRLRLRFTVNPTLAELVRAVKQKKISEL